MISQDIIGLLRCPSCKSTKSFACKPAEAVILNGELTCERCLSSFRVSDGVLDFLVNPHPAVINELLGEEEEQKDSERYEDLNKDYKARLSIHGFIPLDSDECHRQNFAPLLSELDFHHSKLLLDLGTGAGSVLPCLVSKVSIVCLDLKCHLPNADLLNQVSFLLADMNSIPFADGSFDFVMTIGAIHHSYDLGQKFREISRVLKDKGKAIIVSEPVKGLLKRGSRGSARSKLVNENIYTLFTYLKHCTSATLTPKLFFPGFVNDRLLQKQFKGYRFSWLAAFVSRLWQVAFLRKLAMNLLSKPGTVLLGLPLVMIAEKRSNSQGDLRSMPNTSPPVGGNVG